MFRILLDYLHCWLGRVV